MKTVYPTDMVCHLWANRNAHNVRNSAGNVYTRGSVLYSYGQHHAIGAFLDSPADDGKNLLLWNSGRTSNTTTRHASKAWFALSSVQRQSVTRVPDLNASLLADLPKLAAACISAAIGPLQKAVRARASKQYYLNTAKQYLDSARQIYLYVGDKTAAESVHAIVGTEKEDIKNIADTIGTQHAARIAAQEAAKIAAWRAGEHVAISRQLSPMVRIVGDTLETSHGARVPLEHAARLVKIAKQIAARGGEHFAPGTGPQIGHFRVTSIAADFATVIGCHNFTSDEAMHAIKLIEEATELMEVAK